MVLHVKNVLAVYIGIFGVFITDMLGGWDKSLQTLLIFMLVDLVSGWYLAVILKKSPKTESGGLSSSIGWKGLFKKIFELILVGLMYSLDLLFGTEYIREGTIIAYCFIEGVSIIENFGLIGVPIPDIVKKSIDILNKETKDNEKNDRNC